MNKQSETGVLQPPSQNGMFIPRQSIVPLRMGIRYEPPTLALIYKRHETDVKERIYWILLNGLVEWRDARQIARRLFDEHTLMINESIIDIDQVEKLVAKIKKQHKQITNLQQNQLHPDGDISTSHIGLTNSFISPIHTYNSTSKNNAYNISEGELFLENSPNPLQNGSSGYLDQKHSYNHPIIPMIVEEGDIPEDIQTIPDSTNNIQGNKFNNNYNNLQNDGQYLHTMSQDDNSERFNSPYIPSLSSATTNTNFKPRYEQQSPQSPPINTNQLKSNSSNNNDNALGEDSPSVQHSSQQRAKTKNERNKHHLNHNDDTYTASFKNTSNNDIINNNISDDYEFAENTKSFGITENVSAEAQYLTSQYNYGKRRQQQQQEDSNNNNLSLNNPNTAIGGIGAFNTYNNNDYYDGSKQSELNIDHYENNEFVDHDAYSNDQIYNSQNQHTLNHDYHDLIADSQINNNNNTNPSDHLFQTPNNNNNIGNKNNNNNNNSSSSASVNLSSNQHHLKNVFGNYNMNNNNNTSSYSNNAQHIQIPSSLSVSNQSENFQFSSTPIKGYIDTQIEFNNNNNSKINQNNQFIDSYDHNEFIAAITQQNQFGGNTFQKHANIAQQQQQQQQQQQEQYDLGNQGNTTSNMNKSNNAPFFQKRTSVSLDQQLQQQMMFNKNNQQQQQEQQIEQSSQQQDSKKRKGRFGQLKDLATMHRDNEDQRDELEVI